MEDALAHKIFKLSFSKKWSLNPCCNGRCTRTSREFTPQEIASVVLILVVMEDALAQAAIARFGIIIKVLILVVMEDALALY